MTAPISVSSQSMVSSSHSNTIETSSSCVNGFLLINKQVGSTSNQVVQHVRHLFGMNPITKKCNQKAGHTGTLDPFAEGLMLITLGHATKISQFLLDADKTYEACLRFGSETDTGDLTGAVTQTTKNIPSLEEIQATLPHFLGAQTQIPPMYSALKKDGKALYQYAREGVEIERQPRHIEIFQIDLLSFDIATNQLHIRVHCSKGTYLRTLAQDIARHCLSLAHLTQLKRINQNQWHLHDAIDVLTLRSKTPTERETLVRPMDQLLTHLPSIFLNSIDSARFLNGQRIRYTNLPTQKNVRVYSDSNQLLGIAKDIAGVIHPSRLLIEREGFDHD